MNIAIGEENEKIGNVMMQYSDCIIFNFFKVA